MITLSGLKNTSRPAKRTKLLGRGPGSGSGKTCGRGQKGAGARAGSKVRWGYEGGQMRLFMKLPSRGFSNARFQKLNPVDSINLYQVEIHYKDGETVSIETLREKGLIDRRAKDVKLLGEGELTKKVTIDIVRVTAGAREKLEKAKIKVKSK
jgi:large subunit ribosomal protein L15